MRRGVLRKMQVSPGDEVCYRLPLGEALIDLQPLLGAPVVLEHSGSIFCINCARKTNKSFSQGYCYPCFRRLAACDICIVKPELCHFDQGTCREPDWGQTYCMQPHVVYLANSSGLKVGITRKSQVPTRWLDQGAIQALPIFEVAKRHIAGLLEEAMKPFVSDRTDWRRMLKGVPESIDLVAARDALLEQAAGTLEGVIRNRESGQVCQLSEAEPLAFSYPVRRYPDKVRAHNLDKGPRVEGCLEGLKGQYLIFDTGVLNIRKFGGYEVTLETG